MIKMFSSSLSVSQKRAQDKFTGIENYLAPNRIKFTIYDALYNLLNISTKSKCCPVISNKGPVINGDSATVAFKNKEEHTEIQKEASEKSLAH